MTEKLYRNVFNLVGKQFGLLEVVELAYIKKKIGVFWLCRCQCGNIKIISTNELNRKRVCKKSCGCFSKNKMAGLAKKRTKENHPNWNPDRTTINSLKKCRGFIYKQVATILKSKKTEHCYEILGYTPRQLKEHLEKQFDDKMNWDNYGSYWHIDHIIPLSYYVKQGILKPAIINSLDNLRPLEAKENLRKGNKM